MGTTSDPDVWRLRRYSYMLQRRLLSPESIGEDCFLDRQQVEDAAKALTAKKDQRKQILQKLTCTFITEPKLIQYFLKINTSLPTLISLLSGHDAELQLEALCCLTNLSGGGDDDADLVCKMAAPYLVTYLGGNNPLLQDQCAWCVGNLVADNENRASYLVSLGVIHLLLQLLQHTSAPVVQSSAFALVNFAKFTKFLGNIITEDPLPSIQRHLDSKEDNYPILVEIAWLLFYLTTKTEYLDKIRETQLPEKTTSCFINVTSNGIQKYEVITPLVRSLGNMCYSTVLASRILEQHDVLTQIRNLISNAPDIHLRKESLWLLTNIAANSAYCGVIITLGLLQNIIYSLASTRDMKIQACLCLCNLLSHSQEYCDCACQEGVIQSLVPLIGHPDIHVTKAALWLVELVITRQEYLHIFDENHGRDALEMLLKRVTDQNDAAAAKQVATMAGDLLRQYYQC